jgi:hypothetical protein
MHHNTSDSSNSQTQDLSTDTLINNANNSAFNTEICNSNHLGIILNLNYYIL